MLRYLNQIEEAFTLSNEAYPLCVAIVLRLRSAPPAARVREALDRLQRRHLLLQSRIERRGSRFVFAELGTGTPIPFEQVHRTNSSHWKSTVEEALNTRFDHSGPLLRLLCVSAETEESELILVLHHAIMDGVSARLLLHELLVLMSGEALPAPLPEDRQLAWHALPGEYRGLRLAPKIASFALAQTWDGIKYSLRGIQSPPATRAYNRVMHLAIPAAASRRISHRIGREGLSFNSVISAALLRAVRRKLHADESRSLMRAIAFADLRPALDPVPSESVLGCMISMLRFSVPVAADAVLLDVARDLRREMYRGGKAGLPLLFAMMSKHVTRAMLAGGKTRMACSAMSFLGKLELRPGYGTMELYDVHAFITNNVIGPELSGFGKVLFGRIELDLTYLSSEIPDGKAHELLTDIEVSLEDLAD